MTVSAGTRLRLFLQGDLWNQSDCENAKPRRAGALRAACWAGSVPSGLRFARAPWVHKERGRRLDYGRVGPPVLAGRHVHAVSSSSSVRLVLFLYIYITYIIYKEVLLLISYCLLCYEVTSWNPQLTTVYLWYRGERWQQYRLYLMVECVFGRFQRFSAVGTMFWIRCHPSVSLFNNIPQNCDQASGFPFC